VYFLTHDVLHITYGAPAAVGVGESNEKEAVLTRHVSELSASVKGLETDKERLMREVATMAVSMKSLQEELATTQDAAERAMKQLAEAKSLLDNQKSLDASAAAKSREKELEVQVNELMDALEMLTLDKEQLVMDNELLQAQIDEKVPKGEKSIAVDALLLPALVMR
jgi:chromosome segregation ATPase